jgi:hypothetical protein
MTDLELQYRVKVHNWVITQLCADSSYYTMKRGPDKGKINAARLAQRAAVRFQFSRELAPWLDSCVDAAIGIWWEAKHNGDTSDPILLR